MNERQTPTGVQPRDLKYATHIEDLYKDRYKLKDPESIRWVEELCRRIDSSETFVVTVEMVDKIDMLYREVK